VLQTMFADSASKETIEGFASNVSDSIPLGFG
jgi:hypothetical protein